MWRSTAPKRSATPCSICPSTTSMASFGPFLQGSGRAGGSGATRAGTPAPDLGRGGTDIDRNVPAWDDCAVTLEAFREESELFCASSEDRQLVLLRPRIALGSKQLSVAMAPTMEVLREKDGPQKILKAFKHILNDKPEGEL